jgi:hypothetical protein
MISMSIPEKREDRSEERERAACRNILVTRSSLTSPAAEGGDIGTRQFEPIAVHALLRETAMPVGFDAVRIIGLMMCTTCMRGGGICRNFGSR